MSNPSVLLVEDDRGYSTLVADNLTNRGFDVKQAATVSEALSAAKANEFDVLVADIYLGPGPTGLDIAEQMAKANPKLGVVFLTNVKEPRYIAGASKFKLGNASYVHKDRLLESSYLSTVVTSHLGYRGKSRFRDDLLVNSKLAELTDIQIGMLRLMASGMGNPEIAELRDTSVRAVETMQTRIYEALSLAGNRVANRAKAISLFLSEAGLHRGFGIDD